MNFFGRIEKPFIIKVFVIVEPTQYQLTDSRTSVSSTFLEQYRLYEVDEMLRKIKSERFSLEALIFPKYHQNKIFELKTERKQLLEKIYFKEQKKINLLKQKKCIYYQNLDSKSIDSSEKYHNSYHFEMNRESSIKMLKNHLKDVKAGPEAQQLLIFKQNIYDNIDNSQQIQSETTFSKDKLYYM